MHTYYLPSRLMTDDSLTHSLIATLDVEDATTLRRSASVGFYWQLQCLRSRCVLR